MKACLCECMNSQSLEAEAKCSKRYSMPSSTSWLVERALLPVSSECAKSSRRLHSVPSHPQVCCGSHRLVTVSFRAVYCKSERLTKATQLCHGDELLLDDAVEAAALLWKVEGTKKTELRLGRAASILERRADLHDLVKAQHVAKVLLQKSPQVNHHCMETRSECKRVLKLFCGLRFLLSAQKVPKENRLGRRTRRRVDDEVLEEPARLTRPIGSTERPQPVAYSLGASQHKAGADGHCLLARGPECCLALQLGDQHRDSADVSLQRVEEAVLGLQLLMSVLPLLEMIHDASLPHRPTDGHTIKCALDGFERIEPMPKLQQVRMAGVAQRLRTQQVTR
eukprot:scaffold218437_cov28-Tisochrysis_lutea.AAC.7